MQKAGYDLRDGNSDLVISSSKLSSFTGKISLIPSLFLFAFIFMKRNLDITFCQARRPIYSVRLCKIAMKYKSYFTLTNED